MSAYEPGTVAVATVRGVPNVRVFLDGGTSLPWTSAVEVDGGVCHYVDDVTNIRPLVVLDCWHPNANDLPNLLTLLRENYWMELADQIEAQTKPPRIPEPGPWGVVEARYGDTEPRTFIRGRNGWASVTSPARAGVQCDWDRLTDPTLIRDGIEDAS